MKFIRAALALVMVLGFGQATAEDLGYELINPPQNTSTPGKVEVLEFFWYGCPHCDQLEPVIHEWDEKQRADYIELVRVAPPLNPQWANHSRAYYAAEIMGVLDKFHEPMFRAYHSEGKRLFKLEDLADFAGTQGIDAEKFLATMKSFAVETKLMRSRQQAIAMGITGVPAVVVNGKYRTDGSLARGYPNMMKIVDELAAEEKENIQ